MTTVCRGRRYKMIADNRIADNSGEAEPTKAKKKTILIIDDNPEIMEIVSRSLHGTEFHVIGASDGREGIQIAKEHMPDIILLDITMPGFDGFMTGKVIKRNQETKGIPIIFLSARKTKQDITSAIQAGGSDYIIKPFSPHDLLTRIRRTLNILDVERDRAKAKRTGPSGAISGSATDSEIIVQNIQSFARYGDIIVCPLVTPTLVIENHHVYRGIFANMVSDGFIKIILDASTLEKIDGSGLGLLVSIHEALKSHSGSLRIVLPKIGTFNQLLYVKLNDIFKCFDSVKKAVESFSNDETKEGISVQSELHDICMVCGNQNDADSRYCKQCGSNLVISRGIKVLDVIRSVISHNMEQQLTEVSNSEKRNLKGSIIDEHIPSDFLVELTDGTLLLQYTASLIEAAQFKTKHEIGISAPSVGNSMVPVQQGMALSMRNTTPGSVMLFETVITAVDSKNGVIFVQYTDEAKILHSQKNFSVAPRYPIILHITCPSFNYTGGVIEAKILELSRARIVVFSDAPIPEKECLSISFQLPGEFEISSPLVVARKRKDRFMYDIEFAVIDEHEQTKLVQFMYKRQIELAKGLDT